MKNNSKNKNMISEEFIKKVLESKNNDDIKNLFKEKGVDVSYDQINDFKKIVKEELIKGTSIPDEELKANGGAKATNFKLESIYKSEKIAEGAGSGAAFGGLAGFAIGLPVGVIKKGFSSEALKYAFSKGLYSSGIGAIVGGAMGADVVGSIKENIDKKFSN